MFHKRQRGTEEYSNYYNTGVDSSAKRPNRGIRIRGHNAMSTFDDVTMDKHALLRKNEQLLRENEHLRKRNEEVEANIDLLKRKNSALNDRVITSQVEMNQDTNLSRVQKKFSEMMAQEKNKVRQLEKRLRECHSQMGNYETEMVIMQEQLERMNEKAHTNPDSLNDWQTDTTMTYVDSRPTR